MRKPRPSRSCTIIDVARLAGVSSATASIALQGSPRVREKTRRRIEAAAQELGYIRNAAAAALATCATHDQVHALRVAIITRTLVDADDYGSSNMVRYLRGIGYEVRLFDLRRIKFSSTKLRDLLFHEGYVGVIFHRLKSAFAEVHQLDWRPFSLVSSARETPEHFTDIVRADPYQEVTLIWKEIRKAGYRRIGFLLCSHNPPDFDDLDRRAALMVCQSLVPPNEFIPAFLGSISDAKGIRAWYRKHRPDAVVGFNKVHYWALHDAGVRIPRDVAFAHLGASPAEEQFAGSYTDQNAANNRLCSHLDFLIRNKIKGPTKRAWQLIATPSWQPGASLPDKSSAS